MTLIPPPPPVLLAGTRIPAGLGVSVVTPDIDFETYSEAGYAWDDDRRRWTSPPGATGVTRGLPLVGAAVYAEHHTADMLCLAYDLKDGTGRSRWRPGDPPPLALWSHVMHGGILEAWNVGFERHIWDKILVPRYGFPPWPLRQQRCAMAKARAWSLPGALGTAAGVLGQPGKDKEGGRLLDKFAKPRNPTKADARRRIMPADDPEDFRRLQSYNVQDIAAEADVAAYCPDLEGEELEFWFVDQAVNIRGVAIDRAGVRDCIALIEEAHTQYNAELYALTGGTVEKASEIQKLLGWLGAQGCVMHSLDEEAVAEKLDWARLPGPYPQSGGVIRALEIRQAVGSASVKKVFAMDLQATRADRLHDLFSYHAARTGRATGNGPQPTNLPREGPPVYRCLACDHYHGTHTDRCPWCGMPGPPGRKPADWCIEAVEQALGIVAGRSLALVQQVYGDAMATVSGCLRGLFVAGPGRELIASDFSAIEAVVLAALAGEEWRLEVFRAKRDIYVESISRVTRTPVAEYEAYKARDGKHHPDRQRGKIAELASGYQGWIGAWLAFGAGAHMNDDEIKQAILAWRDASPTIVEFWGGQQRREGWNRWDECYGVEGAAVMACLSRGESHEVLRADGSHTGVSFRMHGDALYCTLPSGRHLTYHRPRLTPSDRAAGTWSLSYEGYNTNPKNGPIGWITIRTWGGRLVENIVQAVARDILRHAMVNLEHAGYPIVLHVYDEIVAEVPTGWGSIEEVERIMATLPAWCAGWPVRADGGWRGQRYRKG